MPLDSSLFNDLIEANGKAITSTQELPDWDGTEGDTFKYSMADPENAWRTMRTMWTSCAIKSSRIIADIDRVEIAIDKIIAARGTIVPELDNRNGHRKVAARIALGGGLMHPECEAAMRSQILTWEGLSGPRV